MEIRCCVFVFFIVHLVSKSPTECFPLIGTFMELCSNAYKVNMALKMPYLKLKLSKKLLLYTKSVTKLVKTGGKLLY